MLAFAVQIVLPSNHATEGFLHVPKGVTLTVSSFMHVPFRNSLQYTHVISDIGRFSWNIGQLYLLLRLKFKLVLYQSLAYTLKSN